MEIKVNIPYGIYCESCKFKIGKQCSYTKEHLATGFEGELKSKNCPAK